MAEMAKTRSHDGIRAVIAMLCATGLGYWPLYVEPFVIGALIDSLGLSEAQAGLLMTAEISAIALVTLGCARYLSRLASPVPLAISAGMIVLVGNAVSAFLNDFTWLVLVRIVTGLGSGISLAIGSAALARVSDPDRKMALVLVGRGIMGAVMIPLIAMAISKYDYRGSYLFLAMIPLLVMPVLLWLPGQSEVGQAETAASEHSLEILHDRIGLPVFILLLGMFLMTLGESVLYSFIERKGAEIGMTLDLIALVLMGTTIAGLIGAAIPAAINTRFGRQVPIYASMVFIVASGSAALLAQSATIYAIALAGYTVCFAVCVPFVFGVSTLLGRTGAVTAALGAMIVGGHTIGPSIAGFVVGLGGFSLLTLVYAGANLAVLVCLILLFHMISQRSQAADAMVTEHA